MFKAKLKIGYLNLNLIEKYFFLSEHHLLVITGENDDVVLNYFHVSKGSIFYFNQEIGPGLDFKVIGPREKIN